MKKSRAIAMMSLLLPAGLCAAGDATTSTGFVNLSFSVDGVARTAALYVPPSYDKSKAWPLIVYLHGGGRNGDNAGNAVNAWMKGQPIVRAIRQNPERFPTLVLIPRCPRGKIWAPVPPDPVQSAWRLRRHGRKPAPNAETHVTAAIDAAMAAYAVDKDRVTVTGHSMGGEGTTRYGALHADRLAGIAPSAGSAVIVPTDAGALARMGVWMFQGQTDRISTVALARRMAAAIRAAGGKPRYTEYAGVGHAMVDRVYNDAKVIDWLLNQKRRNADPKAGKKTSDTVDPEATGQTKALFRALRGQMGGGILFGQQSATLYGVGWHSRKGAPRGKCDVKDACGAYPAVYGWDLNVVWGRRGRAGKIKDNTAGVRKLVMEAYHRGGVNTFSWHMWNPVTGKNFYDTTPAMKSILPGGKKHEWYRQELDRLAGFFQSLKTPGGVPVPVIFRPFHEHNLKCFWWCVAHSSQDEYNEAFRFTVRYLRDVKGVHNLLYAVSPSGRRIKKNAEYRKLSPGKEFVDLYGVDYYAKSALEVLGSLRVAVRLAEEDKKIAAMTEGGFPKGILDAPRNYFTKDLLGPLKTDAIASRIAYFMVWQNSSRDRHWIPVTGEPHLADFQMFYKDSAMVFGDGIRPMYTVRSQGE